MNEDFFMRYMRIALLFIILITITGCTTMTQDIPQDAKEATFAGGCFWCMEAAFQEKEGVYEAVSGYTAGDNENPT